ncbi:LolA family protein [Histidinibacterium aquaticum]|uniref:Outer membrane lipoprotein carrier protein LolA n=1 Tax=Histidinibacterium aquaticum TaxID=2613962 RepID=A0A5J5GDP9_9RHOB|nr:outer membrane lipoprotein carrier protein LolA [Histidinibacterium aquaticum]KAA9006008.1 outer membrane lipoprotein carrier protein LolA [Histidinibacterium aquaticum]
MKTLRLLTLLIPMALAAFAGAAKAQQLSLGEISQYLNSFATAEGEFTQVNADGTISTGQLYIKRPGRIRFEYNPPDGSLVMAGGGSVAVFDPQSDRNPERYPLAETPLKIILDRTIDLSRSGMVTRHTFDGTATTVTAQDPQRPELGNIQLKFTGSPVELRQWIVTDETGTQTTVILGDLAKGVGVPDRLFNIIAETRDWE